MHTLKIPRAEKNQSTDPSLAWQWQWLPHTHPASLWQNGITPALKCCSITRAYGLGAEGLYKSLPYILLPKHTQLINLLLFAFRFILRSFRHLVGLFKIKSPTSRFVFMIPSVKCSCWRPQARWKTLMLRCYSMAFQGSNELYNLYKGKSPFISLHTSMEIKNEEPMVVQIFFSK